MNGGEREAIFWNGIIPEGKFIDGEYKKEILKKMYK